MKGSPRQALSLLINLMAQMESAPEKQPSLVVPAIRDFPYFRAFTETSNSKAGRIYTKKPDCSDSWNGDYAANICGCRNKCSFAPVGKSASKPVKLKRSHCANSASRLLITASSFDLS